MKKSIFVLSLFFLTALAFADEVKPLYRLPEKNPVSSQEGENESDIFLVGKEISSPTLSIRLPDKYPDWSYDNNKNR